MNVKTQKNYVKVKLDHFDTSRGEFNPTLTFEFIYTLCEEKKVRLGTVSIASDDTVEFEIAKLLKSNVERAFSLIKITGLTEILGEDASEMPDGYKGAVPNAWNNARLFINRNHLKVNSSRMAEDYTEETEYQKRNMKNGYYR